MKKITFSFFLFFFLMCSVTIAQKKMEKKANKFAAEISKVLKLNKQESKAVYEIQISRMKEAKEIKQKHKNNPELRKAALKKLGNRTYNKMKNALGGGEKGKQRLKKWKQYKKDKKGKS